MSTSASGRHVSVGRRRYLATVWVGHVDGAAGGDVAVDEVVEWFDDVTAAGRWIDANAGDLDGRLDECVWVETVTIDRDSDTVVYDATPVQTGRFVERAWMQTDDGETQPSWSHLWESHEPAVFDAAALATLDRIDDGGWELDAANDGPGRGAAPAAADLADVHRLLVDALRAAWQVCEAADRHARAVTPNFHDGVRAGSNVPELLSAALEVVAAEVGGPDALVQHRPGSWEAEHVHALAQVWRFTDVA